MLYVVSTLVAAIVALIGSEIFPTTLTLDTSSMVEQAAPEGIGEVLTTLLMNIVANPVDALMNANYVGILAWAVVLGVALRAAGERTKEVFTAISDAVSKAVRWVINLAPFGILGLVYASVSTPRAWRSSPSTAISSWCSWPACSSSRWSPTLSSCGSAPARTPIRSSCAA